MRNTLMGSVLVCALGSTSCAVTVDEWKMDSPPYDRNALSETQALDIAEATFRYQFDHNASAVQQKASAYFLEVFGTDPQTGFLARFKDHEPPVRRSSQFKEGSGLHFQVLRITRVSDTTVKVGGSYYEGNTSGSGNTYMLESRDGKWIVTGDEEVLLF